jgi:hypothetical protein
MQVDLAGVLTNCSMNLITLDLSYNNISSFPSAMIYNIPTLENLYFQHNQLTDVPSNAFKNASNLVAIDFSYNQLTNFELWVFLVNKSADFSHNQISTITNKLFFNSPKNTSADYSKVFHLGNNNPTINLTDAVYEMYNYCTEVPPWLNTSGTDLSFPSLTNGIASIDFGNTQINCSCDQSYISQLLGSLLFDAATQRSKPIYNATCTDGTKFLDYGCTSGTDLDGSSVDFSKVYPRECKIFSSENGSLTIAPNISAPTINAVR